MAAGIRSAGVAADPASCCAPPVEGADVAGTTVTVPGASKGSRTGRGESGLSAGEGVVGIGTADVETGAVLSELRPGEGSVGSAPGTLAAGCGGAVGVAIGGAPGGVRGVATGGWVATIGTVEAVAATRAGAAGIAVQSAVFESAIFDSAVFGSAVFESAVFGSAVFESAVFDSAVFESAVFESAAVSVGFRSALAVATAAASVLFASVRIAPNPVVDADVPAVPATVGRAVGADATATAAGVILRPPLGCGASSSTRSRRARPVRPRACRSPRHHRNEPQAFRDRSSGREPR